MRSRILIIGAGPKAAAVVAKAHVLRGLGWTVPHVTILDGVGVGAHWTGAGGYTDGRRLLCTNPEKDLGYPHASVFGAGVDRAMFAFSWRAYLATRGRLAGWTDSGSPRPAHSEWAHYLAWAFRNANARVILGRARALVAGARDWTVEYLPYGGSTAKVCRAHGLVITGPGEPFRLKPQDDDYRITNGKTFWYPPAVESFRNFVGRVLVVGAGDTATVITRTLLEITNDNARIEVITRSGRLSKRQEQPDRNIYFSEPAGWDGLPESYREEFIKETDRGVVACESYEAIQEAVDTGRIAIRAGDARSATIVGDMVSVGIDEKSFQYDRVIVATGFNPLSFTKLFPSRNRPVKKIGRPTHAIKAISRRIGPALEVDGLEPKLHLPALAGLRQGPGFPNLTCLGLLSDRILVRYVSR